MISFFQDKITNIAVYNINVDLPGNHNTNPLSNCSLVKGSMILFKQAFLGFGKHLRWVIFNIASEARGPDILITATPHFPTPNIKFLS